MHNPRHTSPARQSKSSGFAAALLVVTATLLIGCDQKSTAPAKSEGTGKIEVLTTFYPTSYLAKRIAGEHAAVTCPVPAEADPIFWVPDDATIEQYRSADLIVINGAGFEKWVENVSLPSSKVVDTAKGFKDEFIQYEKAVRHSHGPTGEHAHEGLDGHTWLDPQNLKRQAESIRDAMIAKAPKHADAFNRNFESLASEIKQWESEIATLMTGYKNQPLLASHPAYNYIARRYKWNLVNLDLDPETLPDAATLSKIQAIHKKHAARYLVWESAPTPEVEKLFLDTFNLKSVVYSPAEMVSEEDQQAGQDLFSIMRSNLKAIEPAITAKAEGDEEAKKKQGEPDTKP